MPTKSQKKKAAAKRVTRDAVREQRTRSKQQGRDRNTRCRLSVSGSDREDKDNEPTTQGNSMPKKKTLQM